MSEVSEATRRRLQLREDYHGFEAFWRQHILPGLQAERREYERILHRLESTDAEMRLAQVFIEVSSRIETQPMQRYRELDAQYEQEEQWRLDDEAGSTRAADHSGGSAIL